MTFQCLWQNSCDTTALPQKAQVPGGLVLKYLIELDQEYKCDNGVLHHITQ